jgi:hypothetical protein
MTHTYEPPARPDSFGLEPCRVCGVDRYSHSGVDWETGVANG